MIVNIYNQINRPISTGAVPNAHPCPQDRPRPKPSNHAANLPRRRAAADQFCRAQGGTVRAGQHAPSARGDSHAKPQIHVFANLPYEPRAGRGTCAKPRIHVSPNLPREPRAAVPAPTLGSAFFENQPSGPGASPNARATPKSTFSRINPSAAEPALGPGNRHTAADHARHDGRRPPACDSCPPLLRHVAGRRRRVETTDEHGWTGMNTDSLAAPWWRWPHAAESFIRVIRVHPWFNT
jgi:hypothetical protein